MYRRVQSALHVCGRVDGRIRLGDAVFRNGLLRRIVGLTLRQDRRDGVATGVEYRRAAVYGHGQRERTAADALRRGEQRVGIDRLSVIGLGKVAGHTNHNRLGSDGETRRRRVRFPFIVAVVRQLRGRGEAVVGHVDAVARGIIYRDGVVAEECSFGDFEPGVLLRAVIFETACRRDGACNRHRNDAPSDRNVVACAAFPLGVGFVGQRRRRDVVSGVRCRRVAREQIVTIRRSLNARLFRAVVDKIRLCRRCHHFKRRDLDRELGVLRDISVGVGHGDRRRSDDEPVDRALVYGQTQIAGRNLLLVAVLILSLKVSAHDDLVDRRLQHFQHHRTGVGLIVVVVFRRPRPAVFVLTVDEARIVPCDLSGDVGRNALHGQLGHRVSIIESALDVSDDHFDERLCNGDVYVVGDIQPTDRIYRFRRINNAVFRNICQPVATCRNYRACGGKYALVKRHRIFPDVCACICSFPYVGIAAAATAQYNARRLRRVAVIFSFGGVRIAADAGNGLAAFDRKSPRPHLRSIGNAAVGIRIRLGDSNDLRPLSDRFGVRRYQLVPYGISNLVESDRIDFRFVDILRFCRQDNLIVVERNPYGIRVILCQIAVCYSVIALTIIPARVAGVFIPENIAYAYCVCVIGIVAVNNSVITADINIHYFICAKVDRHLHIQACDRKTRLRTALFVESSDHRPRLVGRSSAAAAPFDRHLRAFPAAQGAILHRQLAGDPTDKVTHRDFVITIITVPDPSAEAVVSACLIVHGDILERNVGIGN